LGEACADDSGWYSGSPWISTTFDWNGFFRERAHKRDSRYWASVELIRSWSPAPAGTDHIPGVRGNDQGPIILCGVSNTSWVGGYGATCSRLVDDPMAWSPRWNPEETRVAYQRTDGIWAIEVPVVPGRAPTQLFSATTEIAGFDW
jgi:hypothetical protein